MSSTPLSLLAPVLHTAYEEASLGNVDEVSTYEQMYSLRETLDSLMEALKPLAISKMLHSYGSGEHQVGDHTVSLASAPGKWDFGEIAAWVAIKEQEKALKDKRDLVEQSAKATYQAKLSAAKLSQPIGFHNEETGEVLDGARYTPGDQIIKCGRSKKPL